jgi:hypothetical protein
VRWTDSVIASRDAIVGNGDDIVLATFLHDGALAKDQAYALTESILLPATFTGRYTLFVRSDALGDVF